MKREGKMVVLRSLAKLHRLIEKGSIDKGALGYVILGSDWLRPHCYSRMLNSIEECVCGPVSVVPLGGARGGRRGRVGGRRENFSIGFDLGRASSGGERASCARSMTSGLGHRPEGGTSNPKMPNRSKPQTPYLTPLSQGTRLTAAPTAPLNPEFLHLAPGKPKLRVNSALTSKSAPEFRSPVSESQSLPALGLKV